MRRPSARVSSSLGCLLVAALLPHTPALAQDEGDDFDEVQAAAQEERANANFEAVMQQNVFSPAPAVSFDDRNVMAEAMDLPSSGATVEVPLRRYEEVRSQLGALAEERMRRTGPAVVLGAARYEGEARQGALALKLTLQVTLGAPGKWKTVPLVGDNAVIVEARSAGQALPLSAQNGYHVWVTKETGEKQVEVSLLLPSTVPRGSLEYDFLIARTPVTRFICRFPVAGLEPRLTAAVRADTSALEGATLLDATLRPTARIHLVGFHDLGAAEAREAKLYAESLNLLSVDQGALELFTVIRYNILYAGTKQFEVRIPAGFTVVSADGKGAFRFTLEEGAGGTLLKGETAFPIRNRYEISLRLRRNLDQAGETFTAPWPRPLGVEREHGWLGVEVIGKLQLEERAREQALAVDMRQLPVEMLESAVSPILLAYRFHRPEAAVQLAARRLPEKEPATGSVDRMRAFTVLSPEGKALTELRLTLRNRLRHNLVLELPAGAMVRSTLLDGQPVKPSRDSAGKLMLPLKRSAGRKHLEPFTLSVVLEQSHHRLGAFGQAELSLPTIELPVSTLAWSLFVPARNTYTAVRGDVEAQSYWGQGQWHQSPGGADDSGVSSGERGGLGAIGGEAATTSNTGAMPVRIHLPKTGKRLEYQRYWLEPAQAPRVRVSYVRSWFLLPAALFFLLLFGFGLLLLADALIPTRRIAFATWPLGLGLAALATWPLAKTGGGGGFAVAILLAMAALLLLRGWLPGAWRDLSVFLQELPNRLREARAKEREQAEAAETEPRSLPWRALRLLWKLGLAGGMILLSFILLLAAAQLGLLLLNPLG